MIMDEKLCGTAITGQYVADHLKKSLGPEAILESIESKQIGIGEGFVSNILHLKLKWKTEANGFPESVIVKAPTSGRLEEMMSNLSESTGSGASAAATATEWVPIAHNIECEVYDILNSESPPPVRMPACYAAVPIKDGQLGMLVLEDLSDKAAIHSSFLEGLNYAQVLAAITEICHLQGWCLTTSVDWRSRLPALEDQEDLMKGFLSPVLPGLKTSKEKYPETFGNIDLEKMAKLMEYESFAAMMIENRKFISDLFVHGDFHKNNFLFEKKSDGSLGDRLVAVIDFQGAVRGNPLYDIARVMTFSVSTELRRNHEQDILRYYYDTVKSIAGDKFSITFDQVVYLYRRLLAIESVFLVSWMPAMMAIAVKSEGDQKVKDERRFLENVKAVFDDSIGAILD